MTYAKYLCIDDQVEDLIQPVLDKLQGDGEHVHFERMHPKELSPQYDCIVQQLSSGEPFGLLVDLRLDELPGPEGKVFYRGSTLAQDLRTRMALGEVANFPIVLWSVNDNIIKTYNPDASSHDLFDAVYIKDGVEASTAEGVLSRALELKGLALGYSSLKKCFTLGSESEEWNFEKALGLSAEDLELLDPRLISYLSDSNVIYIFANRLLSSLIRDDGALVGTEMLAARLGVDQEASDAAWREFLAHIEHCKYSGVFSGIQDRWWWFKVDSFWYDVFSGKGSIRKYSASQRVELLNQKFGLSLVAASPIESHYSTKYSTVCVATRKPIDTIDAFKVFKSDQQSWQENSYVSAYAAKERIKRSDWKLDALESDRYKQFMEDLKNGR